MSNKHGSCLITFDPGEDTGYSIWKGKKLVEYGVLKRTEVTDAVMKMFNKYHPKEIVVEQSFQRPWLNPVNFLVTGMLVALAEERGVKIHYQSPALLKGPRHWPATNELKKLLNNPHAQDAVFHGLLYLKVKATGVAEDIIRKKVVDNV